MTTPSNFVIAIIQKLLVGDLKVIGLLAGFVGGILLTLFGMPSLSLLNSGAYVGFQSTPRIRLYSVISRLGLALVVIGFALQLVTAVTPPHSKLVTGGLIDVWIAVLAFISALFWGASACVKFQSGWDNDVAMNRAFTLSSRLNAMAATFAALAAALQAAKPLLVQ